jgi:SOS-response transcriptional repressor LexA
MTMSSDEELMSIGDEILDEFRSLNEGSPGEVFQELLGRAESFRKKKQWGDAEDRCRRSHDLSREDSWRSQHKIDLDLGLAEGTSLIHWGVVLLSERHLDGASEYFERAAEVFRNHNRTRSAGVAYIALGRVHEIRSEWDKALWAYQQSLNEFSYYQSDPKVGELRNEACSRLKRAVHQLDCCTSAGQGIPDSVRVRCIPVAGDISAGAVKLISSDDRDEYIGLDADHSGSPTYVLRVSGESMINAGIRNRDYVFIRDQEWAHNGQIAAVRIVDKEDTATLKRYYKEKDHVRLEPANDQEKTIIVIPNEEFQRKDEIAKRYESRLDQIEIICPATVAIEGKLVAVLRVIG